MAGKDARGPEGPRKVWRRRWTVLAGASLIVGASLLIRHLAPPGSASAQAPARSAARPQAQPAGPAAPAAPAAPTDPAAVDPASLTVMAVVNGEQITREQLARECLRRFGKDVLESMVNKQLIMQECERRGVTVTDEDVEREIEQTAAKFGLSKDRWLEMLERERDIPPEEYRSDVIWPALALQRLAAERIDVTPEELRKAYESEFGPKVKARMIAVTSRAKAEQLRAQALADPNRFGDLAKNYSEDSTSAAARGMIPLIRKHVGDDQIEQVAFSLKEGEISPIIQVGNQYLILKCEQHVPPAYLAVNQVAEAEQRLRERIKEQKLRDAAAAVFRRLQDQAQLVNCLNDEAAKRRYPGAAAVVNGRPVTLAQLAEECLARHGKEVLRGEINRLILTQELARRGVAVAEADIDAEIARAALAYGFEKPDGSADVERWLQEATQGNDASVELYVRDVVWPTAALKKLVTEQVRVTEEDLRKGFESNYGERVEVLAIVLGSQRQANAVWEMARNNPTDEFFGELAEQYSIEPVSRANRGKVPPIRRYGGQPVVEEEAFRLKPGELSGIIAVGDKYVILRCLGRTQPVVASMTPEVREELEKDLREKKLRAAMAREFDRLMEVAQIDNFLEGTSQSGKRPAARPAQAAAPAAAVR